MIRAAALVVLVGLHSTAEARGPETRPSPETRPNPKVSDIPPRGEVSVEPRPFPHREVSVEPRPLPPRFSKVPDFGRSRGLHDGHRPTDFPRKDGPGAPPSDLVHSDKPPLPPSGFPQGPAGELLPLPSDLPQGPPGELTPHASTHANFGKRGLRGGRQAEDFPPKDGPVGPPSNLPRFPEGPTGGLPPLPSDLPQKPPGELPPLPSDLPLLPGHPGEEEPHRLPGEEEPHPFPLDQSDRPPLPSDLPPRPLIHPPHSHGPQHAPVAQPSGALRGLPPKPDFLQSSKRWEPLPFPLFADHSLPAGNNPAEPRGPPPHSAHPGAFDFPPFANDDIPRPADGPAPPQGPPRVRGRP